MSQAYILNMASQELLRRIERENERLVVNPDDSIAPARLERLWKEEKELHAIILEAERDNLKMFFVNPLTSR